LAELTDGAGIDIVDVDATTGAFVGEKRFDL